MKKKYDNNNWSAIDANAVIDILHTNVVNGLSEKEAKDRLDEFGKNDLPEKKKENKFIRFLKQFDSILIYVLFVAAIVTAVLGQYFETIFILLVTLINASIGFVQENKAGKALDKIKKMLSSKAQVIRDRIRKEIDTTDLTIGDIVLLAPGDKVPADLRLITADNLKIDESTLTGESVPSEKLVSTLDPDTILADKTNMAFSGTAISTGTGIGAVVATGENTEIGMINKLLDEVPAITTPLIKQTAYFGKMVSIVIVVISLFVFVFGYFFRDYQTEVLLLSVIGLAVAAIPEGMPAILSIILAIGVRSMARRNAIIRHLPSVETLGAVSVIFTDKTGTLTKNEMTVKTLQTADDEFKVTGIGYIPEGVILKNEEPVDFNQQSVLTRLICCMEICNDAAISEDAGGLWTVQGDPTEGALITLYRKANFEVNQSERIATIPFDSEYKYMAALTHIGGENIIFVKGAPDRLFEMVSKEQSLHGVKDLDITYWNDKVTDLANRGQRIIGAAYKVVDSGKSDIKHEDIYEDLIFLGMAGIIDPPHSGAIEAIKECAKARIRVKMITGDLVNTAKAIGLEMGIGDGKRAIQGKDIEKMTDDELEIAVHEYDIFARTTPKQKLRLVNVQQLDGSICAMTGDGINDAPALKKADVGIAMGIKGTEVAKDAAEMILVDDNFRTIVSAVEEGRRVYSNLKKTILFILPTNGAESFLIIASILFGTMIPITPVQILWINMITSITVSLALAFENIEPGTMERPPRLPNTPLLSGYFIWRILFISVLIGGGTLILNMILLSRGYDPDIVKTITLQVIVFSQLFHLFNCRSIRGCAFNKNFFNNKAIYVVSTILIILQLSITYLPFMNRLFATQPLPAFDWLYPILFGLGIFFIIEIEKAIMRRMDKRRGII
ncbi:cation-transporting P-type ATPase [Dysgonomonas sp. ZJ709]|uniref:cation-transporting P-type ATPase n=1 Tax=Dysgonomonas sp. ZJ709 TaxID=2709797 RepID=UPI0013EC8D42|nr:cation-transporting P-type ATPase [Dysgonomonas sp. ZJ709]